MNIEADCTETFSDDEAVETKPHRHPQSDGFRRLADFLDALPASTPVEFQGPCCMSLGGIQNEKATLASIMRVAGKVDKVYTDRLMTMKLGAEYLGAEFVAFRSSVCERIVTGTVEIPEKIIPARTEEVVEWKCLPILGSEGSEGDES